jgi:histone H3/H4
MKEETMSDNYLATVQAYQEAIAGLYGTTTTALRVRGEGDIAALPDLDERAGLVVERSQALGEEASASLASPQAGQRQLAQLQLLAAAAIDLHLASDLVRRADEGPDLDVAERGASVPGAIIELQEVLNASPEGGIAALVASQVERGGPASPAAARKALQEAVETALEDIKDDAALVGQATFANLMQLPVPAVKDAANIVLAELLTRLGEGVSKLLSKAVVLVTQAIDKILKAIGHDVENEARQQAAKWIEDLQKGTLFEVLVDRIYEIKRIQDELDQKLEAASADLPAERFNQASEKISELVKAFEKQKKTIEWLLHGLAWARPWVMALTPWGPVGLTAGYVLTIGYIVYSGGDYIDWYRAGSQQWLDRVPGVRSVVAQALQV